MKIKPILHSVDIDNDFKSREYKVSISIDTSVYEPDSDYKVFIEAESPSIKSEVSSWIKANYQQFDLVLAFSPDILDVCSNSEKLIFGSCWIDLDTFVSDKKNEISFLTSSKAWTRGHLFRQEVFEYLKRRPSINEFSVRSLRTPPRIETKNEIFENAKFSIVIENDCHPNYLTEKLIDCLATKTIPIYCGSPTVGEYFDLSGIFTFNTIEELEKILDNLTPEIYDNLREVIERNYKLSCDYFDFHKRVDDAIDRSIGHGAFIRY